MTGKDLKTILEYAEVAYECEVKSLKEKIVDLTIVEQPEYIKIIITYISEFNASKVAETGHFHDETSTHWIKWMKTESLRKLHEEIYDTFNMIAS